MPDDEKKITELFDVDVETVGLVRKGANKKRWFLMKSEEGKMPEEKDVLEVLNELEQVEEGELSRSHWNTVVGVLKSLFTQPEPEPELEDETVEKSEVEQRLEALEKSHRDQISKMQEEIDQVRKDAKEEVLKAEERVDAIEKAKRETELEPVAKVAGLEVGILYELEKANPKAYEAITERFQAFEKQLDEAGLWEERGSSQPGEQDAAKKIMARAAEIKKSQPEVSTDVAIATAAAEVEGYDEYRQRIIKEGK